jgi:hypothetical protein
LKAKLFCETARLPQFFELGSIKNEEIQLSKTKHFCGTSSFFAVDKIKNKTILIDFIQKWKVECRADALATVNAFPFFDSTCGV